MPSPLGTQTMRYSGAGGAVPRLHREQKPSPKRNKIKPKRLYILWIGFLTSVHQQGPRAYRLVLQEVPPCIKFPTLLPLENLTKMGQSIISQENRGSFILPLKADYAEACFLFVLWLIIWNPSFRSFQRGKDAACLRCVACLSREVLCGSCVAQALFYHDICLRTYYMLKTWTYFPYLPNDLGCS